VSPADPRRRPAFPFLGTGAQVFGSAVDDLSPKENTQRPRIDIGRRQLCSKLGPRRRLSSTDAAGAQPGNAGMKVAPRNRIQGGNVVQATMNRTREWLWAKGPVVLWLMAVLFLVFIGGILVAVAERFPSQHVRDAYVAGTALYSQLRDFSDPLATDLWGASRTDRRGVTINRAEKVYPGLTLYTTGHAPKALLITADGDVVHEWEKPFSEVWDESSPVRRPVQDRQVYFDKALTYPDGGLLAIYIGVGDNPYGYGMVRLDPDSNLIWKNLEHFHHDIDVGSDDRIYGLTHEYRRQSPEGTDLTLPLIDDFLVVVSPSDGRILKRISLLDAVNDSKFRRLLWQVPFYSMEDALHTNNVDVLDREEAARLATRVPVAAEGQVLLSFREAGGGTLALLDVDREEIVWATTGPWRAQHDPDVLPNGDLIVFDNRGSFESQPGTRIIEYNPATHAITWRYGDTEKLLDSAIRGSQQRLPNGNTLITESSGGRLLEVTSDGEIVWEYINPEREERDGKPLTPVTRWAERIDPETLTADFRARIDGNAALAAQDAAQ
jgi:hypothetical protein